MKRSLLTVLGSTALLVAVSPAARADAFLSLHNDATTLTCNNSTAAGVTACTAAGFTTAVGSNIITFSGIVGGYNVGLVTLVANSPGTAALATATDTKTNATNLGSVNPLQVAFAVNNFTLPGGNPLVLSASQSATFSTAAPLSSSAFTGFANAANTLAPGVGTADPTPACVNPVGAPPANACSSVGAPVLFVHGGAYAISGMEDINLNVGGTGNFTGTVDVSPTPEPGSLVLLATGLIGVVGGGRRMRRRAAA